MAQQKYKLLWRLVKALIVAALHVTGHRGVGLDCICGMRTPALNAISVCVRLRLHAHRII